MQDKCAQFFENDELTIDVWGVREVFVYIVVAHQRCSNQRSDRTLRNLGIHHYKLNETVRKIYIYLQKEKLYLLVQINR